MKRQMLLASALIAGQKEIGGHPDLPLKARLGGKEVGITLRTYDPNADEICVYKFHATESHGPLLGEIVCSPPTDADRVLIAFLENEPSVNVEGKALTL